MHSDQTSPKTVKDCVYKNVIFPEISYDDVTQLRGLDISIVTTAKTDEEAHALLKAFGMPFAKL